MNTELASLLTGHWLSDLANFSAFYFQRVPKISWIGFYLDDGVSLKLGPFQGKIACTEIAYSRGVCGAAFSKKECLIVDDVHEFPGHIACDPESRSEIVLPVMIDGDCVGVLDVDSTAPASFTSEDQSIFEEGLRLLLERNPTLAEIKKRL